MRLTISADVGNIVRCEAVATLFQQGGRARVVHRRRQEVAGVTVHDVAEAQRRRAPILEEGFDDVAALARRRRHAAVVASEETGARRHVLRQPWPALRHRRRRRRDVVAGDERDFYRERRRTREYSRQRQVRDKADYIIDQAHGVQRSVTAGRWRRSRGGLRCSAVPGGRR